MTTTPNGPVRLPGDSVRLLVNPRRGTVLQVLKHRWHTTEGGHAQQHPGRGGAGHPGDEANSR
ncbi:hypothetical protein ACWGH8_06120 [Nonomuraea muscovyensis]